TPRHACCLWSGQSPQSRGHPSRISVCVSNGMVPGLLKRCESRYMPASEYSSASNRPCSGQRFRRYTLSWRILTSASTTTLQTGQMLFAYSTNTSSRSTFLGRGGACITLLPGVPNPGNGTHDGARRPRAVVTAYSAPYVTRPAPNRINAFRTVRGLPTTQTARRRWRKTASPSNATPASLNAHPHWVKRRFPRATASVAEARPNSTRATGYTQHPRPTTPATTPSRPLRPSFRAPSRSGPIGGKTHPGARARRGWTFDLVFILALLDASTGPRFRLAVRRSSGRPQGDFDGSIQVPAQREQG